MNLARPLSRSLARCIKPPILSPLFFASKYIAKGHATFTTGRTHRGSISRKIAVSYKGFLSMGTRERKGHHGFSILGTSEML